MNDRSSPDVTKLERRIACLEAELKETKRSKEELVFRAAHDLRTPLNVITGFAELIHDGLVGPVTPTQKDYLREILNSCRQLVQVASDLTSERSAGLLQRASEQGA